MMPSLLTNLKYVNTVMQHNSLITETEQIYSVTIEEKVENTSKKGMIDRHNHKIVENSISVEMSNQIQ